MRKWWFGAAVGVFTMIFSYPWLFPVLRDWFPRGSPQVWYIWAGMGVASFAVLLYSGNQFFTGAWQALKHRSANMHSLIAMGTGVAWVYSTIALLFPAALSRLRVHGDTRRHGGRHCAGRARPGAGAEGQRPDVGGDQS
jgi:Cu+-exporting ATPase